MRIPALKRLFVGLVKVGLVGGFVLMISIVSLVLATAEKPEINVAQEWNAAIAQLGIEPVYPPQEDIAVGDVILNVAGSAGSSDLKQKSFLGRSVRIGHIDLTDELKAAYRETYRFGDTAARPKDEGFWPQAVSEPSIFDAPAIRSNLPLVVFPEFKISVSAKVTTFASMANAVLARIGMAADWNENANIELRIPAAETYGVNSIVASRALVRYCGSEKTKMFCTDAFVRSQLSMIVGDAIHALCKDQSPDAKAAPCLRVEIILVSRVFLIRAIDHVKGNSRDVGFDGHVAQPSPTMVLGTESGLVSTKPATANDEPASTAATKPSAPATHGRVDGQVFQTRATSTAMRTIALKQTFQRPVVMGFRAVRTDIVTREAVK